jgi:hypothetical protein
MWDKKNVYRLLVGKPEEKRLQERPSCRWVNSIKMLFGEAEWGGVDWNDLDQDIWTSGGLL